ncbi:MAG: hypothetical protein GY827_02390 [Cytophagales bacterium]|nr:hypothetical protein [Cytophagales bacterium]
MRSKEIISNFFDKVNTYQSKYPIILWILGLQVPSLLITACSQFKSFFSKENLEKDFVRKTLVVFSMLLISVLLSIRFEFFSLIRFAASLHNLVCILFLIVGYFFAKNNENLLEELAFSFRKICILIIAVTIGSFFLKQSISHSGLLFYFTDNKFTFVKYNRLEYVSEVLFPRTTVLAYYPNGTAILLLVIYCVSFEFFSPKTRFIDTSLLNVCLFLTGSRLAILLGVVITIITLIRNEKNLKILVYATPILLVLFLCLGLFLMSYRQGSASTRSLIYTSSFEFMLREAPFMGVGIKPIVASYIKEYPLGSHSTILGGIFRLGLVFGAVLLLYYVLAFIGLIKGVLTNIKKFNQVHLVSAMGLLCVLVISLAEDIDTHLFTTFYIGTLVYLYDKNT